MADSDDSSAARIGRPLSIGALTLFAAFLSFVAYLITGHWPAEYGGWGAVFFAVVGFALVVSPLFDRFTDWLADRERSRPLRALRKE